MGNVTGTTRLRIGPASRAGPASRRCRRAAVRWGPCPPRPPPGDPHRSGPARPQDRPDARRDLPRRALRARLRRPVPAARRDRAVRADHRQAGQRGPPDALRRLSRRARRWPPPTGPPSRGSSGRSASSAPRPSRCSSSARRWSPTTAARSRPGSTTWSSCPASAARPPTSSSATPSTSPASRSTPTSAGWPAASRWTDETDPVKVEHAVGALFEKRDWTMLSHHLIWHGRRVCHSQKPACGACPVAQLVPVVRRGPDRSGGRGQAGEDRGPRMSRSAGPRRRLLRSRSPRPCWSCPGAPPTRSPRRATPRSTSTPPRCARSRRTPASRTASPARPTDGGLPDLTLPCLGGGPDVDLASLAGPDDRQPVAVLLQPCLKEMPALQEFHEKYGDQVPVLGIDSTDVQPQAALEFAKKLGVTYPLLADPGGDLSAQAPFPVIRRLSLSSLFIDADGDVAYQQFGGVELLRRAGRPGRRAPRDRSVIPGLAAAGRAGGPRDPGRRPDPLHAAARRRRAPRCRPDALRRGPERRRAAPHRARPRHALPPGTGLLPRRVAGRGRGRGRGCAA